jgi:hypothetical protein
MLGTGMGLEDCPYSVLYTDSANQAEVEYSGKIRLEAPVLTHHKPDSSGEPTFGGGAGRGLGEEETPT